jgi:hypothetical protein
MFNKIQYKLSFFHTLQKNALFKMLPDYLPALLLLYLSRFHSNALTRASAAENAALRSRSSFNLPAEFLFQCIDARSSRECRAPFQTLHLFYLLSFFTKALTSASAAGNAALRSRSSFNLPAELLF